MIIYFPVCPQVINCNKSVCTMQITDTTGSHQFPAMQRLNISRAHAFILVYSVTSRQSLTELGPILQNILEVRNGSAEGIPIMLAGNKCDETENREVNRSEGEEQAKKWRCNFTETSAKTNFNVKELFRSCSRWRRTGTLPWIARTSPRRDPSGWRRSV